MAVADSSVSDKNGDMPCLHMYANAHTHTYIHIFVNTPILMQTAESSHAVTARF